MTQPALFGHPTGPDTSRYPKWLQAALKQRHVSPRNLRWGHCRTCQHLTLTGDDADRMALKVTLDPHPLTLHERMSQLLAGNTIYLVTPAGTHTLKADRIEPGHLFANLDHHPYLIPHDCHRPRHGPSLAHKPDPTPAAIDQPLPF